MKFYAMLYNTKKSYNVIKKVKSKKCFAYLNMTSYRKAKISLIVSQMAYIPKFNFQVLGFDSKSLES